MPCEILFFRQLRNLLHPVQTYFISIYDEEYTYFSLSSISDILKLNITSSKSPSMNLLRACFVLYPIYLVKHHQNKQI